MKINVYNKTMLYDKHMALYKNKKLCDEIQKITNLFHELEFIYKETSLDESTYDGFNFDIISIDKSISIEENIKRTKMFYNNTTESDDTFSARKINVKEDLEASINMIFDDFAKTFMLVLDRLIRVENVDIKCNKQEVEEKLRRSTSVIKKLKKEKTITALKKFADELNKFCGEFKGLYYMEQFDWTCNELMHFYWTMHSHYLLFDNYIVLIEEGSNE